MILKKNLFCKTDAKAEKYQMKVNVVVGGGLVGLKAITVLLEMEIEKEIIEADNSISLSSHKII